MAPPRSSATPPPPSTSPKLEEENARSAREEEVLPPQDLSGAWGYTRRGAPRPRYVRNTQDPIIFSANPIGFYSGVSVQGNQLPPHPVQVPGKSAVLTWAGFERTATGSRVFFQLSAEAEYAVTENDGLITIKMKKTRVNVRNNLRRLDLSYFKTPVQTVKVRRRGRSAVATLRLKRSSTPEVSYVDSQNGSGYKLLVVSFTHGAEPVRTSPAD